MGQGMLGTTGHISTKSRISTWHVPQVALVPIVDKHAELCMFMGLCCGDCFVCVGVACDTDALSHASGQCDPATAHIISTRGVNTGQEINSFTCAKTFAAQSNVLRVL